jgi:sterol desaturase/sphingolipid hydroxylase (fatty acid hydroxylase superfamily)
VRQALPGTDPPRLSGNHLREYNRHVPATVNQRVLYPALLGVVAATALATPGWRWFGGATGTASPRIVVILAAFYALIALLERRHPYRTEWTHSTGDLGADSLHLALTGPLVGTLFDVGVRGFAIAAGIRLAETTGSAWWPVAWPLAAQVGLAILVAELGHYAFHRLTHERALPWRLHATHHSAPRLYWLNATRFHPLDLFALLALQSIPLLLLGIPARTYASYALFAALYGQLQHCNVDLRTGRWLDWLFSTPALHRWHHSRDPSEGNHNYGAILNAWDHVFGTYFRPTDRAFEGAVGIDHLDAFPRTWRGQLLSPFRWRRIVAASAASG